MLPVSSGKKAVPMLSACCPANTKLVFLQLFRNAHYPATTEAVSVYPLLEVRCLATMSASCKAYGGRSIVQGFLYVLMVTFMLLMSVQLH